MTNNIAQRESLGQQPARPRSLKASYKHVVRRLQRRDVSHARPSDARWAILLVAVGDILQLFK